MNKSMGPHYDETFAPVLNLGNARMILSLAVIWKVPARHGDVPNAYVSAEGGKQFKIHIEIPLGVELTAEELKAVGLNAFFCYSRAFTGSNKLDACGMLCCTST